MNTVSRRDFGRTAVVTLNRPERLNALSGEMRAELHALLRQIEEDENIRCTVITGSGKAFCVGADLRDLVPDLESDLSGSFHPLLLHILLSDKIFIAAVNGTAAGAGISLALACDLRLFARGVKFVAAFQKIGLAPDTGLAFMLPRLMRDSSAAARILLLGSDFSCEEAVAWGLGEEVEDPLDGAMRLADQIVAGPFASYSASKKLLFQSRYDGIEAFLKKEAAIQGMLGKTYDFHEGVNAFSQKRKAEFRGS